MSKTRMNSSGRVTASRKQKARAAATITVIGGSLVIDGQPANAATFDVTNINASGAGSLSEAIGLANASPGLDTITFSGAGASGTITLDGSVLANRVSDDLTIVGPGRAALTLTNSAGGVLYVYNDADLTISALTIANVSGGTNPRGITSDDGGDLTVTDMAFTTIGEQAIYVSHTPGEATHAVRLTDVDVTDGGTGTTGFDAIYINEAAVVALDDVTVTGSGVGTTGSGVDIQDVLDLTISDTVVTMSADSGIEAYPIEGPASITDSMFNDNGSYGLGLGSYADDPINLTRVEANDNGQSGLSVYPGNFNLVDVTANGNSTEGISGKKIDEQFTMTNVTTSGNGDDGIELFDSPDGAVTMTNVTAVGNGEAGISLYEIGGEISLTTITASDNDTGGLYLKYNGDKVTVDGFTDMATVDGTTTNGNGDGTTSAWSFYVNEAGGDVTVSNMAITGEFWIDNVVGDVSVSNATVARNTAGQDVTDPQFYLFEVSGDVTIDNVEVTDANEEGVLVGAVDGTTTINNLTVSGSGNQAFYLSESDGDTTITNSTFADNDVSTDEVVRVRDSDVTIEHSTIAGNTVTDASPDPEAAIGLDPTSNLVLDHVIVADNDGAFSHAGGASTTAEFSLIEAGSGLPVAPTGTNIETTDPELGPLQGNGGDTMTRLPLAGSDAIDAGDQAITGQPEFDQRGAVRVVGAAIDIGATEIGGGLLGLSGDATVSESGGSIDVTVSRTGVADLPATVKVNTVDGTAVAGTDFTAVSETVSWTATDFADKTVTIPIASDQLPEGDETFNVELADVTGGVISSTAASAAITITDVSGAAIESLAPQRFADTRPNGATFDKVSEKTGKLGAGDELEVRVAGRGGVPADAVGVVMNITAIQAEANGFVTAHACVAPRPLTSSLNYTPGVNLGNEVIAGLSADGDVCLYTSSAANLSVDVVGYITATSPLVNVTPGRVLDTRANGETVDDVGVGAGKTTAGATTTLEVAGRAGVPADAAAVVVNVTAVGATGTGFVTVSPCVTPTPNASSLNYVAGVNRGNELVASLDADGNICLFTSSSINLTVDVVGYLPGGSNYTAVDPARFLDSRPGQQTIDTANSGDGKLGAGEEVELQVAGRGDVPDGAKAVVVNVTAIQGEANGFVTVHPCQNPRPLASSLNYVPGTNGGNEIVAQLSADGRLCLYTSAAAHLTVDVVGYLS